MELVKKMPERKLFRSPATPHFLPQNRDKKGTWDGLCSDLGFHADNNFGMRHLSTSTDLRNFTANI